MARAFPRSVVPALAFASLLSAADAVGAEAARVAVRLRWNALGTASSGGSGASETRSAVECPSEADVLARTEAIIDQRPVAESIDAAVQVTKEEERWRADIVLSREGGAASSASTRRSVHGESCEAVADAVSLIVALAARGTSDAALQPADSAAPPSDGPSRSGVSLPSRSRDERAIHERDVAFFTGLALSGGLGILPKAELGPGVFAGIRIGRFRVSLEVAASAAVDGATAARSDKGASFRLIRTTARTAYAVGTGPFTVGPTASFAVVFVGASGFGADEPSDATARIAVAALGAVAYLRVSSVVGLRASLEGAMPLSRPTFFIEGVGDVHRPAALGGLTTVGAELRF